MASITKNHLNTIKACRYCPMCKQACPSEFISYRESDTPRGRAMLLQSVYNAGKEFEESVVESIYNCFVCGSCLSWCAGSEIGNYNIPELIKFARKDIVDKNKAPQVVKSIRDSIVEMDNPYKLEGSASFSNDIKESKADVLYYMGPEINFRNQEIAVAALKIFNQLNVSYTLLENEPESGKILDLLGYRDDALSKAENLHKRISSIGCKTIVVSDPLAYDAFCNDYPDWGFGFNPEVKILHFSEFIAGLIKSGDLKLQASEEIVTLADSEFLGRFNNVFEAPREVIKSSAGTNFAEMQWTHEKLLSTGEAAFTFNDQVFTQGKMLGEKISKMADHIQAQVIVTLSATAKNNIKAASASEVVDIAEFTAARM